MRILFIVSIFVVGFGQLSPEWDIATNYTVKFSAKKASGTFDKLEGIIEFDPLTPEGAKFDIWVEAASISTGNSTKDKHARSSKWLDTEQYPKIGFTSSEFQSTNEGYQVKGELFIHGIAKEVSIPFTFINQVFIGSFTVNRKDFGIEGPFLFGGLVGNEIKIDLRVPVTSK